MVDVTPFYYSTLGWPGPWPWARAQLAKARDPRAFVKHIHHNSHESWSWIPPQLAHKGLNRRLQRLNSRGRRLKDQNFVWRAIGDRFQTLLCLVIVGYDLPDVHISESNPSSDWLGWFLRWKMLNAFNGRTWNRNSKLIWLYLIDLQIQYASMRLFGLTMH